MDQPGKVTKPARGQLNRANEVPLLQMHPWEVHTSMYYCLQCSLFIHVHVHSRTFAVVPADMATHQMSTKESVLHVFILYGYM